MSKISYIISSIGKSNKLEELINILINNLDDNEVILIDNSKEGILKFYKNNKKIHYFHEKESGLSNARNRGAKEATNELLVFLDDDIIPKNIFFKRINDYTKKISNDFIIGGKIIPKSLPKYLPPKYQYIAGLKDYGDKKLLLPKYTYLGGCLLIMTKKTFEKLTGFDKSFGHNGKNIGANEDVIIQDIAHKKKIDVIYDPNLCVIHHWNGSYELALERIKTQGKNDRITDKKYHKIRLILKHIKYNLFILIKRKSNNLTDIYDIVRYKSYVQNRKNR